MYFLFYVVLCSVLKMVLLPVTFIALIGLCTPWPHCLLLPPRASSLAFLLNCPQCMISVCPLTRVLELTAYILASAAPQIKEHNLETLFPCLILPVALGSKYIRPFHKGFWIMILGISSSHQHFFQILQIRKKNT